MKLSIVIKKLLKPRLPLEWKLFFSLAFAIQFFTFSSFATHNRAGEITFRYLSGDNYEITVTTYTRASSCQADRCEIEINYGDGSPTDTIKRTNGGPCPTTQGCEDNSCNFCGEIFPGNPDIKINIYRIQHGFPGPGIYKISVDDPNRNADVVNVPNSVNTSFYIETYLYISPFGGVNNSPVLDFPPVDVACANLLFEHNPGAHDPDGDSLVFSLLPNRGAGGALIPDYSFPNNVPGCTSSTLTINSSTGLLSWSTPVCCPQGGTSPEEEEFNVAILIEEFRNGSKIGSVLRDMQIEVDCECKNDPPVIFAPSQLCVFAGEIIDTLISATDPNGDNVTLTASGEPLSIANSPAEFIQPTTGDSTVSSIFHWETNCMHVRNNSYNVIFRAEDDNAIVPLVDYHTLGINVIAPRVKNPIAVPEGNNIILTWETSFCNATGYQIYRRIDSSGFNPGNCQTGLPSGTGYSLTETCSNVTGNTYTDNNHGAGLVHGQKYCYVIVACLANGSENVVSEEFCTELINDIPVITNVSVFVTDPLNGKDSIMWAMPKQLDTLNQYHPPYQYKIYRSDGFNPALIFSGQTSSNTKLALTDTFFIDTLPLNTFGKSNTYKIELWSNGSLVGSTTNASSVFLSSAPTDNALNLSWEEHVPWSNSKYFVYKKNPAGTFDFLAGVSVQNYKDTGLVNGEEYCYYVRSFGTYSSPGIIDTILNNSQIHCNRPYDNVPPCRLDSLDIQADCNLFQNTLTWNNPNNKCADDVTGYKIYFTPLFGGEMSLIETINSSVDTSFLNRNLTSIAGCYSVSAIDTNLNESTRSDSVCVDNCPEYELPNIFTPGEDGKNDFFRPFPYKFVESVNMQIYNRWGQLVFETTEPKIMWDGKNFKSKKMCPSGVYYYVCQVHEIHLSGIETKVLKGYFHLLLENGNGGQQNN